MSLLLKLDSSSTTQDSDNFLVQYANIELPGDWEVGLIKGHFWYSYFNISAAQTNNIIRYSTDGGSTWETNITLPNGIYSIDDLNAYVQSVMKTRGHYDSGNDLYYLSILPNFNTLRCDVTLSNNYQLDLTSGTVGTIHTLLGFTSKIVTATETGSLPVDITNGINSLEVQCSLTDQGYSNEFPGPTLASFVPDVAPGANIVVSPHPPIYLPVNTKVIRYIRIRITDQLGRRVSFNGENVTVMLHLRRVQALDKLVDYVLDRNK